MSSLSSPASRDVSNTTPRPAAEPPPRPKVISLEEVPFQPLEGANGGWRVPIDRERAGCRHLIQRVFRYGPGASPLLQNPDSEDVMYVVSGEGEAEIGSERYHLRPGTGLFAPPGIPYRIHNPGPEPLELVSVLSPQPGRPASVPPSPKARPIRPGGLAVHESEEQPLPAGEDRYFKLMIDPRYGCRYVTQFIGFIEKSRAPMHVHTYEEVIYILGGRGIVHIADGDHPMSTGTCIYLPPGTPHCLENTSEETLRLLGVFCPAGSPADRKEEDDGG